MVCALGAVFCLSCASKVDCDEVGQKMSPRVGIPKAEITQQCQAEKWPQTYMDCLVKKAMNAAQVKECAAKEPQGESYGPKRASNVP